MATGSPESGTSQPSPKRPSETLEIFHPEISPTKRPKTLSLNLSPSSPPPSSKGKTKIVEDESESDSCGICFSENGKAIRGWIDSCDHYFCFVCIMEWAKVESRCPMCKRRFSTIHRPPKDGLFLSERIVNVPVRDQVYHYSGNATIGPPNLYLEVHCCVCQGAADESLLLLCDLCDSAAHTYCVGLGATVPEGDWFCKDCSVLRDEHTKSEMDRNCDSQTSSENFNKVVSSEAHVSILDVVRESRIYEHERPSIAAYSSGSQMSLPIVLDEGDGVAENMTRHGPRLQPIVGHTSTELGARTLQRCRNVHERIQALRENWNAFRSGSLSFSSSPGDKLSTVLGNRSGQRQSSSCSSRQSTSRQDSSCDILPNRGLYHIDKAWKMMDVAKSIRTNRGRTSIDHEASIHLSRKVNSWKETGKIRSKLITSNCKQLQNKDRAACGLVKRYYCSHEKEGNYKYQMFEKEKRKGVIVKGIQKILDVFPLSSPGYRELPSSGKAQEPVQFDSFHGNGGNLPRENFPQALSNCFHENDGSSCLIPAVRSLPVAAEISCAKQEHHASSSCNSEGRGGIKEVIGDSKVGKADDAKSEIQSLVKLNLKLLSSHQKLEVDLFKEVARHATHSILAACGFECPKVGVRSFSNSVCCHVGEVQQLHRSTLMPTSCRECFYGFVKTVVSTIMFERTGRAKRSCRGSYFRLMANSG